MPEYPNRPRPEPFPQRPVTPFETPRPTFPIPGGRPRPWLG